MINRKKLYDAVLEYVKQKHGQIFALDAPQVEGQEKPTLSI